MEFFHSYFMKQLILYDSVMKHTGTVFKPDSSVANLQ